MKKYLTPALVLLFMLSLLAANLYLQHDNVPKLLINTLFACLLFYKPVSPHLAGGSWLGVFKGIVLFSISYILFWLALSEFTLLEEKRVVFLSLFGAICFRPQDSSWHSAVSVAQSLFCYSGLFYLFDRIWDHFF